MAKRAAKIILFPVKVKKKISVKTSIRPKKKYHTKIWKRKHRVRIGGRKINKTRKKRSAIRKIRLVRIRIRKSKPSKSPTDLRK